MRRLLIALALSIAGVGYVTGPIAGAQTLSVAAYCDLTVERLRLASDSWSRESRGPTDEELTALWQRYGVTAAEYYRFASENRVLVDDYLASRPDIAQEIQRLAATINAAIRQRDPR